MYTLPQEIEVWYIIPAIRKELATCMITHHKLSYEKVGNILGISKAAISQYVKKKRAAKIKLHKEALKQVGPSCDRLIDKKSNAVAEITGILDFIRKNNLPCEVCGEIRDGVLEDCTEIKLGNL